MEKMFFKLKSFYTLFHNCLYSVLLFFLVGTLKEAVLIPQLHRTIKLQLMAF